MMKRMVVSLALAGSVALGTAGAAAAAPGPSCTGAPARIAQLQTEESQVSTLVAALQSGQPHGRHGVRQFEREIAFLTRVEARLTARIHALQSACPSAPTSGGAGGGVSAS